MARGTISEEHGKSLATAIGNAVVAAAALEKALLAEIARRQLESEAEPTEILTQLLDDLGGQPAGRLLGKLRAQGIPSDLADRIEDVLARRNRMVHRIVEDIEVATALVTGDGIDRVLARIAKIESDCAALMAELQPLTNATIEALYGIDIHQAAQLLTDVIDLEEITNVKARGELEDARTLLRLYGMPEPTNDS